MIYAEALNELLDIVGEPCVPPALVRSAARLTGRIDLCLVAIRDGTMVARSAAETVRLEPSVRFLDYLGAARAGEWERALAIESEMLRSEPEAGRKRVRRVPAARYDDLESRPAHG
jgi:hypothetical protein